MRMIALLTDFGTRDSYVAAMKGVIASRCEATIIDLSHEIAPQNIFEAAFFLADVVRYFPGNREDPGAVVFTAVIDPGVGTDRRIIAASESGRTFLAPDNGLLSRILGSSAQIHSVVNEAYFLKDESATFHGRDRFAPLAAAISRGVGLDELGGRIEMESLVALGYSPPAYGTRSAKGRVIAIDRFGNIITDIEAVRLPSSGRIEARFGRAIVAGFVRTYAAAADSSEPFLTVSSRGTFEIAIRNGSAAEILQLHASDPIEIVIE